MDDKKRKIIGILIIIIGVLALAAVIYFLFFYNRIPAKDAPPPEENKPASDSAVNLPATEEKKSAMINITNPPKSKQTTADDLKIIAASFAERFGSYSNQANYGNIKDLKIFMSTEMKNWADDFIESDIKKGADTKLYYGMKTKAVSAEILEFNENSGSAEILISAQRSAAIGDMNNIETSKADILIKFIKERGVWKVDAAEWQSK